MPLHGSLSARRPHEGARLRARAGVWAVVTVAVVLATRTIVYALAPQSALLDALAHDRAGPDLTVPLVGGTLAAAALAAAVLGLAALAVRERLLLEGRRLVARPAIRPGLLGLRALVLFAAASFAFAMLESTIHWREGLGWHGLHCLVGPVHRDAIPVLAALSLVAVAVHGAIEHLLAWTRRLFAQLAPRLFAPGAPRPARRAPARPLRPAGPLPQRSRAPPGRAVPVLACSP